MGSEYLMSRLISSFSKTYPRASRIRERFRTGKGLAFIKPNTAPLHSHGLVASERSGALKYLRNVCDILGLKPRSVQMSKTEQRRGLSGTRTYHWIKDFTSAPRNDSPSDVDVIIDVDHYLDMNAVLATNFQPYCLYTTRPLKAACSTGEFTWKWNDNNEICVKVAGTGGYRHQLWNYSSDCCDSIDYGFWFYYLLRFLGTPLSRSTYNIDIRKVSEHHSLVYLTPITKLSMLGAWASLARGIEPAPLLRFEPLSETESGTKIVSFNVATPVGLYTAAACVDSYANCYVPVSEFDTCRLINDNSKNGLTPYHVGRVTNNLGDSEKDETSQVITSVVSGLTKEIVGTGEFANTKDFTYLKDVNQKTPKPSMTTFMSPLYDGGFAPTRCLANDLACVEGRIKKPACDLEASAPLIGYFKDYIEARFNILKGKLNLVDIDMVYERQPRSTQQAQLDEAMLGLSQDSTIQAFQKAETYQKITDPRNISPTDEQTRVVASRIQYAISKAFKECMPTYVSGLSPAQIAQKVASICAYAQTLFLGDFSRMDGHVSPAARTLEEMILRYLFADPEQDIVDEYLSRYATKGRTAFGVTFKTGFGRNSGHFETSNFNSLLTDFIVWLGYVYSGDSPSEAASRNYAILGDDSIVPDLESNFLTGASSQMGQVLTSVVLRRGDLGVEFLARKYSPEVWYGDPSSTCDLVRTLSGFHMTPHAPDDPVIKLIEKCRSLAVTDGNTPGIGVFCRKVLKLAGVKDPSIHKQNTEFNGISISDNLIRNRNFHASRSFQDTSSLWPNDNVSWVWGWCPSVGLNLPLLESFANACISLEQCLDPPTLKLAPLPKRARDPIRLGDSIVAADPEIAVAVDVPTKASKVPVQIRKDSPSKGTESKGKGKGGPQKTDKPKKKRNRNRKKQTSNKVTTPPKPDKGTAGAGSTEKSLST